MSGEEVLKAGYAAYGDVVGGVAHTGKPMPAWEDLPPWTKRAWAAFLQACLNKITENTCA